MSVSPASTMKPTTSGPADGLRQPDGPVRTGTGSLVIAGSGIASVAHMTLETLQHIKQADKVFYLVCDPVTEAFLQEHSREHHDLNTLYDTHKPRMETYVQMAEVMLKEVRRGFSVVGVFYGHPTVFVYPTRRAIAIAVEEGYPAKILPGISAEDCMFADLNIDPSDPGCVTYEATDFLARDRALDVNSHLILWQVGCVGVRDLNFQNEHFNSLVARLEAEYGPDHSIIHYMAPVLPQDKTVMDRFSVKELRSHEVQRQITSCSTFYIAPKGPAPLKRDMAIALGIIKDSQQPTPTMSQLPYNSSFRHSNLDLPTRPAYGTFERRAVEELGNHTTPSIYRGLHATPAMKRLTIALSTDPSLSRDYMKDPSPIIKNTPGLSAKETLALLRRDPGLVRSVMRDDVSTETTSSSSTSDRAVDTETADAPTTPAASAVSKRRSDIVVVPSGTDDFLESPPSSPRTPQRKSVILVVDALGATTGQERGVANSQGSREAGIETSAGFLRESPIIVYPNAPETADEIDTSAGFLRESPIIVYPNAPETADDGETSAGFLRESPIIVYPNAPETPDDDSDSRDQHAYRNSAIVVVPSSPESPDGDDGKKNADATPGIKGNASSPFPIAYQRSSSIVVSAATLGPFDDNNNNDDANPSHSHRNTAIVVVAAELTGGATGMPGMTSGRAAIAVA